MQVVLNRMRRIHQFVDAKWIQMDAGLLPTLVSEQILAHDVQLYGPVLYLKLAWPFHHFPRRSPSPKEIMAKSNPFPWSTMVHQPADCDELATAEAHDDLLTALLTRFMTFNTCIWKLPHNQGQARCFPSKRPVPKTCVPVTCPWTSAMPAHPRHTAPTLENDAIHKSMNTKSCLLFWEETEKGAEGGGGAFCNYCEVMIS